MTNKTIKLLESAERRITKNKNDENVPQLEKNEVALVHCHIVHNQCQRDTRALCAFFPNKSFSQSLNISPSNHTYSETSHSEFSYNEVWFTNRNYVPLQIEDRLKLILLIKLRVCNETFN